MPSQLSSLLLPATGSNWHAVHMLTGPHVLPGEYSRPLPSPPRRRVQTLMTNNMRAHAAPAVVLVLRTDGRRSCIVPQQSIDPPSFPHRSTSQADSALLYTACYLHLPLWSWTAAINAARGVARTVHCMRRHASAGLNLYICVHPAAAGVDTAINRQARNRHDEERLPCKGTTSPCQVHASISRMYARLGARNTTAQPLVPATRTPLSGTAARG